jgi:hypothetical protein
VDAHLRKHIQLIFSEFRKIMNSWKLSCLAEPETKERHAALSSSSAQQQQRSAAAALSSSSAQQQQRSAAAALSSSSASAPSGSALPPTPSD